MKKSKQAYYDKYFKRNWNNIKNTWKGIANTFNNCFASIAEITGKKHKIFT